MDSASPDSALPSRPQRLLALDAFRGMTILAMILVNNPGDWGAIYWPLEHAEWFGWTPTDLIFPFFLFIMGTALAYSLRKHREGAKIAPEVYWRIGRRTAVLLLLGLGLGLFGRVCDLAWKGADGLHLETLRFPGVLQRIALVYFVASLIVLHVGVRGQAVAVVAILLGYWGALAWHPQSVPPDERMSPEGNVVRHVDLAVFGASHMYTQAQTEKTDPEGLLSTLPAVATTLLGYWAGLAIQRRGATMRTAVLLVAVGLAVAAAGQAWGGVFPISKKLWTSSLVLLTGGLATAGLGACLAVFDVAGWRRLARPFEIVGVNAIFVFVASGMLARLLGSIPIAPNLSAAGWIYQRGFTDHIADPKLASLGLAVATVAFWWAVLWIMARRGWSVRV